ncbi:MAG TPA: DNA methyltransferase [Dehalococcoidia bacterium]|nr:DNA methyltransferase [Dehalococcoidia bacterium]
MKTQSLPLGRLVEAPWNANRVPPGLMRKLRRSLEQFGVVENLVARPHPSERGRFEVLSGNHRLRLLAELGYDSAPVVVVELDDERARLLAQTLNRSRGSDDPQAYAQLLEHVLSELAVEEVTALLPETEATIDRVLRELGGGDTREQALPPLRQEPRSRPGEIYQLGPHRLACGDATDAALVAELQAGVEVALLATDPPYGIELDHGWRDGVRQPAGSARAGMLANDDRADWSQALQLCAAPVAYLWHSALFAHVARGSLLGCGFELRAQIIWAKQVHALGRGHYQWAHESCWYAVRKGCSANWQGGRKQTTVWTCASPILPFGDRSGEDAVTEHPTQKPLELFERPILNHTAAGAVVFDPFAGSGTALIAAEKTGRRCLAIELDPRWCDLIRDRYDAYQGSRQ